MSDKRRTRSVATAKQYSVTFEDAKEIQCIRKRRILSLTGQKFQSVTAGPSWSPDGSTEPTTVNLTANASVPVSPTAVPVCQPGTKSELEDEDVVFLRTCPSTISDSNSSTYFELDDEDVESLFSLSDADDDDNIDSAIESCFTPMNQGEGKDASRCAKAKDADLWKVMLENEKRKKDGEQERAQTIMAEYWEETKGMSVDEVLDFGTVIEKGRLTGRMKGEQGTSRVTIPDGAEVQMEKKTRTNIELVSKREFDDDRITMRLWD